MKILSYKQFKQATEITLKKEGITNAEAIERAAFVCFNWMHGKLNGNPIPIHVFCGTGNNGGCGLVIARYLKQHGYNVSTYVINAVDEERTKEFLLNYNKLKDFGVWPEMIKSSEDIPTINQNDMVIDAIFGLGLKGAPKGILKETITYINGVNPYILSIDVPSGLHANKPVIDRDAVIKAYHVLTFQGPKLSFMFPESQEFFSSWEIVDVGLDKEFFFTAEADSYITEKQEIKQLYKYRKRFSNKWDYGHSLLVGGSYGKIGAISLASRAAISIGSGLVTALLPKCGYIPLQTLAPEIMVETSAEESIDDFEYKCNPSVIGVGVGLGTETVTKNAFKKFLQKNTLPLVLDADAINILAEDKKLLKDIPEGSVLTPHEKEFERLVGKWSNDFDRLEKLKELAKKYNLILVLKGVYTTIADANSVFFNTTGNPALSTAGTGDVLTGVITGLLAQGYNSLEACLLGVYLHGKTAEIAVINDHALETFTANNCIEYLSKAYRELLSAEKQAAPSDTNDAKKASTKNKSKKAS